MKLFRQAAPKEGLRPVKNDRDMGRGKPEDMGNFSRRELLDHSKGDHVSLHLAQLLCAAQNGDVSFRHLDELVHGRAVVDEQNLPQGGAVARPMLSPADVPRCVPHDHGKQSERVVGMLGQAARLRQSQEGREGLLYGV